jgi:D-3-phosphoglycerate dehydrogenase
MDILITENIDGEAIGRLETQFKVLRDGNLWKERDKLAGQLAQAKAVIVRNQTKVDSQLIDAAKSLVIIGRAGVGYDNIDVKAASKRGIVVSYAPNENTISTAEHAFALMLGLYRKLPRAHVSTAAGEWDRYNMVGREIYGKTLGILGFGKVGARVAMRAKAFGMKVIAYDKFLAPLDFTVTESGAVLMSLEDVLAKADIISCHLPRNEGTIGLMDYSRLKLMKPDSVIVNTGRGEAIVEKDLIRALKENIIAGAALDVREKEPPVESELNRMNNVILTPHVAGLTVEAQEKVIDSVAADIARVLHGEAAVNYVNFPVPNIGA